MTGDPAVPAATAAPVGDGGVPRWTPYRSTAHYLHPAESLRPPFHRELRHAAAEKRTFAAAVVPPAPPPPVPGAVVLAVPGFGSGDAPFAPLRSWLAEAGWDVQPSRLPGRKRCGSREIEDLTARAEEIVAATGRRVVVVGHSRGGQLGKALAKSRPDLVAGLVAFGSPLTNPFGAHLSIRLMTLWLSWRTRLGFGEFLHECATGECCRDYHDAVVGRVAPDLPFWSVVSRTDGVVDWRAALDPQARVLFVESTHFAMPVHPQVRAAIATALTDPRLGPRCLPTGSPTPIDS